jgi:hypothetical protein
MKKLSPVFYPETKPPGINPDDMDKHLQPVWCNVRNSIVNDQIGIKRCLENIRSQKRTIRFLKERVVVQHHALAAIGSIKEK